MAGTNLQDLFLNQVRKEKVAVSIYLINGFQHRGLVKGFDNYAIMLENDGKQFLVYKHAVATITPTKAVKTMLGTEESPIDLFNKPL